MTNPTTNGETKSTAEQKLAELEKVLDSYENDLGLKIAASPDVEKYLNISQDELKCLSPEECGEAAFLLAQEALFIQKEINKHKTRLDWAKFHIDRVIAPLIGQYDKFTPNKKELAIKNDAYASKLNVLLARATHCINRLSYLPGQMRFMAETLIEYQRTKRNQQ